MQVAFRGVGGGEGSRVGSGASPGRPRWERGSRNSPSEMSPVEGRGGLAFTLPMGQSSDVGCPGKGVTSGEAALCRGADRGGSAPGCTPGIWATRPGEEEGLGGTSQRLPWPPSWSRSDPVHGDPGHRDANPGDRLPSACAAPGVGKVLVGTVLV